MPEVKILEHAGLSYVAEKAAENVRMAGGTPYEQLQMAKKASGQKNLTYMPHHGKCERERRLKRMKQL
jgi:hypothetical protein